jgi:kynurenine formamidase
VENLAKIFDGLKIVDLTHSLSSEIPTWNGSCGFSVEIKKDYDHDFRVQKIQMHAGVGTHMDAPSHRFQNGLSIAEIPVETLIVSICLVNVVKKATPTYLISIKDLEEYERAHGKIPSNSLVIGYTGWDRFWHNPDQYRNVDKGGMMRFPGFAAEAAEFLLERNVAGIAIDTLSPDPPDSTFPVHRLVLGADKYIIENIANAFRLTAKGCYAIALPIKGAACTEAPVRVLGLVHK